MPSLTELVERVNKGESIDSQQLEAYQESANSAERFLSHHAAAMLQLRAAQQHMVHALEAIDYADQKVLNQFVSVGSFLGGPAELRCGPIVRFAAAAISRRDYALGVEAIQNAVSFDLAHNGWYTDDREHGAFIARQYDRVAQCAGWSSPTESIEWDNKLPRVAVVVSSLADDEAPARAVAALARHHDPKRARLSVYSSECFVRRDRQAFAQSSYALPSTKRGATTIATLDRQKVPGWLAPTDCDVITSARELANQLVADRIDIVIFDVTLADPIACLVAQWDVARVKVNLCRRVPMHASGVHCVCYTEQDRFDRDVEFWKRRGVECRYMLEGIDLDEPLGAAPERDTYGIADNAVVLATAGNGAGSLDRMLSNEFCDTMIEVLRAHPQAIYLLIGEGELAAQKRRFESAGVGKRVGYAGRRKDLPGFLRLADLYIAEFPACGGTGVLQAMSVERPVVAMRWGDSAEESLAATFVGAEAAIARRDAGAFVERIGKLIREPAARAKLGKALRARIEQHFGYAQTARHVEQLCEQLVQRVTTATPARAEKRAGSDEEATESRRSRAA